MGTESQVLAMYDVRGIQSYIFKTNHVKEIIGASYLVESIIEDAFKAATKDWEIEGSVISEWNDKIDEPLEIIKNPANIKAQILFVGGGNAYILYKNREICLEVNRAMSRYVLEHTYSLQLAIAMIDKTENYYNDYVNLNKEMTRVKQSMKMTKYMGALPIIANDSITGYPLTKGDDNEKNCTEVRLKLQELENVASQGRASNFENLITLKGEDSQLAIVHIDGNNLGMRIRSLMEDASLQNDYEKSVQRMRRISHNIKTEFESTYAEMEEYLNNWVNSDQNQKLKNGKNAVYIRKIILAGDDVTFVCNAHVALSLVEFFADNISTKLLFNDATLSEEENKKKYSFSVCAGISYIYSHFPFSTGYVVAEECCESAKKRAKQDKHMTDGQVGNWVDFQICKSVQVGNLEKNRFDNYRISDGTKLLNRPFYMQGKGQNEAMDSACQTYDFRGFKDQIKFFTDENKMPRSFAKEMRNTYPYGKVEMKKLIIFAKSRNRSMPDGSEDAFKNNVAKWYDALEMMDLFVDMKKGDA
ncbi:MAG: hypothetical protein IJ958_10685 [Agathobacter sp.]|nr:hypothetical protein [Agathobacter sp.]